MQAERIKILQQIDELDKQRCDSCSANLATLEATCKCPATVEIRKLGQVIIGLTKPRNVHEFELLEKVGMENLTEDVYLQVKSKGLREREIAKVLKVAPATMYDWRKKYGLLGIRSVEV